MPTPESVALYAEGEADHAGRDGVAAEATLAPDDHADAEHDRDQADDEAPDPRARRDRRQRDPGTEQPEHDADPGYGPEAARQAGSDGKRDRRHGVCTSDCCFVALLLPVQPRQQPQHDHVGADEEHDEALDQQRQVRCELGLEDLGIEVAGRRAGEQAAEEQCRERDPDGGVAAEQRYGDADERDRRGLDVAGREPELPAEHVDRPREAGERAGDRHREEVVPRDVDAAVARRLGVEADRLDAVAERRPVEDQPVDDEGSDRDEEPDVEALEVGVAPEDGKLGTVDDVVRDRDVGLRVVLERPTEAEEEHADPDRDPVEHDRRDHLVGADRGFQEARDACPERAAERRRRSPARGCAGASSSR